MKSRCLLLEATPGFEPGIKDLQSHALPLGYVAKTDIEGDKHLQIKLGAGDEIRTRYLHLGKVALCQMSYARVFIMLPSPDSICCQVRFGASGRSRTNDTRIFSPLLYQLSYRGKNYYVSSLGIRGRKWRPRTGSNRRPPA